MLLFLETEDALGYFFLQSCFLLGNSRNCDFSVIRGATSENLFSHSKVLLLINQTVLKRRSWNSFVKVAHAGKTAMLIATHTIGRWSASDVAVASHLGRLHNYFLGDRAKIWVHQQWWATAIEATKLASVISSGWVHASNYPIRSCTWRRYCWRSSRCWKRRIVVQFLLLVQQIWLRETILIRLEDSRPEVHQSLLCQYLYFSCLKSSYHSTVIN